MGRIEIVRRLVEQRNVGSAHPNADERGDHRFTARDCAHRSMQVIDVHARCAQGGGCLLLDVPVRVDRVEQRGIDLSLLDRRDRVDDRADAEKIDHRAARAGIRPLRQIVDDAGRLDGSGCRSQSAADQTQQRRLADAVETDKTRRAGRERTRHSVENAVAVGPGEREVVQNDGRNGGRHAELQSVSVPDEVRGDADTGPRKEREVRSAGDAEARTCHVSSLPFTPPHEQQMPRECAISMPLPRRNAHMYAPGTVWRLARPGG